MESPENSFAWLDTSSDSLESNSMTAYETSNKSGENLYLDNYNGKQRKEKRFLNKTLPYDEPLNKTLEMDINEEQSHSDTKTNSNIKKKKIKIELESDNDLPKKKQKVKHIVKNGKHHSSQDHIVSYDETYLNLKVKQEESSATTFAIQSQKKRKRKSSNDLEEIKNDEVRKYGNTEDDNNSNNAYNKEYSQSKKKKKTSKKRNNSDSDKQEMKDKTDIDEIIQNKQNKMDVETFSKHSMGNKISSTTGNNTFQEESDCDEISAIKCDDDDHNFHTISLSNQSILKNNTMNSFDNVVKNSGLEQDSNKIAEDTKHRTPRILDRIRFEDEDNTASKVYESDNYTSKSSSKVNQFVKTNPNLKLLSQKFHNNVNLTQNDDIWILKCPKDIDIKAFCNTSLNIHGKCKIKVGGQTYDGSAEEQCDSVALLTMEHCKYKITNLPLSGIINMRKRIPKAHFRDDNIMVNNQTNFLPLPEIKCRHPLFGSNYKKALKIPAAIAERLNGQYNKESIKAERRKKKYKIDTNISEQFNLHIQNEMLLKSELDVSEASQKKKKKRKIANNDGPISKKAKRIKHDPESAEAWESEKAIEKNLFNF